MNYEGIKLTSDILIDEIFSIHYFEYTNNFTFAGESHDFWEFICVDNGEVNIQADSKRLTLKKGDIAFHKPNEFHNVRTNGVSAPNLVVISFGTHSPAMKQFEGQVFQINETERNLLANILTEAKRCIVSPFNNPMTKKIELSDHSFFGSQQMVRLYLEELLIHMIRSHFISRPEQLPVKSIKKKSDMELYQKIETYLDQHICEHLTINSICQDNLISRSQLQKLFREKHNCGIIDYFSSMKIELAKQVIRENHHNFTQIAEFLGYSSIQYFSRQFKKITGMTPSEYAISIKIFTE